jgi:hypothetical protein
VNRTQPLSLFSNFERDRRERRREREREGEYHMQQHNPHFLEKNVSLIKKKDSLLNMKNQCVPPDEEIR